MKPTKEKMYFAEQAFGVKFRQSGRDDLELEVDEETIKEMESAPREARYEQDNPDELETVMERVRQARARRFYPVF